MSQFLSSNSSVIVLALVCAALWGVGCGICERVLLAPRRRFSTCGPAYAPSMILALFGGCSALAGPDGVRFLFALLMAVLFFAFGAIPALATFYLSRRVLHTRFCDEKELA